MFSDAGFVQEAILQAILKYHLPWSPQRVKQQNGLLLLVLLLLLMLPLLLVFLTLLGEFGSAHASCSLLAWFLFLVESTGHYKVKQATVRKEEPRKGSPGQNVASNCLTPYLFLCVTVSIPTSFFVWLSHSLPLSLCDCLTPYLFLCVTVSLPTSFFVWLSHSLPLSLCDCCFRVQ